MKLLRLGVLLLASKIGLGQEVLTLERVKEEALKNNQQLKVAQLDLSIAEEKVNEFRAIGLPQINAEGNFQHFLDIPVTLIPAAIFNPFAGPDEFTGVKFGTDFNVTGSITASQLLFDGSFLTGLKASKMYPQLMKQNVEKTEKEILGEVTTAYYMVLVSDENLKILSASRDNTIKLQRDTKVFLEEKLTDSTNYEQLELAILQLDNAIIKTKRDKSLAQQILKMHMGWDINQEVKVDDKLSNAFGLIENSGIDSSSFDPTKHYDHQLLETQKALQELNLQVKKAAYLPSLGAFFTHQQQAMRNELNFFANENWFPTTIWGLKLTVPIFSSGMRKSQVQQTELEIEKIDAQIKLADEGLKLAASNAISNYSSALDNYIIQKKAVEISERLLKRTVIKVIDERMKSSIELTQIQNQYLEVLGQYVGAMYQLINAKVEVDKAFNLL